MSLFGEFRRVLASRVASTVLLYLLTCRQSILTLFPTLDGRRKMFFRVVLSAPLSFTNHMDDQIDQNLGALDSHGKFD